MKRRRLSGRHQISTDGKHLIDGLAFGRPWLRVPRDRPALELPPRKRARITYDEEHDEDEESEDEEYRPQQLLLEGPEGVETDEPSSVSLRVMFDDTDKDDDFEEEIDDEDNITMEDVEESLSSEQEDTEAEIEEVDEDELRLLLEDNAVVEDVPEGNLGRQVHPILQDGLSALDKITALRSAFPLISVTTIQNELVSRDMDLGQTFTSLEKTNDAAITFDQMLDGVVCGFPTLSQSFLLDQEDSTFKGFESQESAELGFKGIGTAKPLIQEVESVEHSVAEDSDEEDFVKISNSTQSKKKVVPDSEASSSESSSDDDSEESSSDDDSDDSDSDSDSNDDSDSDEEDNPALSSGARPYLPNIESDGQPSSDSDSDSSSSSDSSNGSGAEVDEAEDSNSDDSSSSSDDSSPESEPEEVSAKPKVQPEPIKSVEATAPLAPGSGLTKTQKRNARRREAKRMKQLQVMESQSPSINEAEDMKSELLARKRALLSAVSDSAPGSPEKELPDAPAPEAPPPKETPVAENPQETTPSTGADSGPRRLKVDMGAGRRLLFGALGLKNPKSKADEDKLRKDLMKDVRPLKNPRTEAAETAATNGDTQESEDPDSWREKISYRAVECCHDGIVLSEPPFPFVQRWDPQQQYKSMKKRKRSSQNFYDDSYYDDSYYDENSQWNEEEDNKKSKKRKSKGGHEESRDSPFEKPQDEDIVLSYDDVPAKRPGSSQFTDIDDLPSLPSDVKTLATLQIENIKPGMVVTWKQLLMSKATKWQPQISSVTGLVLALKEDNVIDLLLAKRDREPDEREYDEHTGKRVYEKFEAPADDEDEVDDGRRKMSFIDLFDLRLVQNEPSPSLLATPANKAGLEDSGVNKVSKSQDREEHVAEELDTQEVKARVEAELKAMAKKDTTSNQPANDPSTNESAENEDTRANSPSRQLHETALAVVIEPSPEAHGDEPDVAMDVDVEDASHEDEAIIPNSIPSLDIPSQPFHDSGNDSRLTPLRDYPMLAVPSSVSSIRSGRQPPSNYELGGSLDTGEDSVIPDTTPRAHETTPTPKDPEVSSISSKSSSPFPSIEEIFHTCHTSRQTQSPGKSTQQSVLRNLKSGGKGDPEYDEAMRKLDEGDEESDQSLDKSKSIRSLFPNATQPEPLMELPGLPSPKTETPKKPPKFKKEKTSPFMIPEGSQVITLSSSPASERFEEDYAHDSIDETYQDSPLPRGSGWVKKTDTKSVPRRETRSRGRSVPATGAKSQAGLGRQSVPVPTASAVSQIKGRRKTSLKF